MLKRGKVVSYQLSDLSTAETIEYLTPQLPAATDVSAVINTLGGRISDLENFVAKVNTGASVQSALQIMIEEAQHTIRNEGFGGKMLTLSSSAQKWNQLQLWKAIKQIVSQGEVSYDSILFDAFKGDNEALKSLVQQKILCVKRVDGVDMVTAYSPLYLCAFKQLVYNSPQLARGLNILEKKNDISKDMEEINAIEEELLKLKSGQAKITDVIQEQSLTERRNALAKRLIALNQKVEKKAAELRELEESKV